MDDISIAQLLAKIEARNTDKRLILVIWDNAAYNKGPDVRAFLSRPKYRILPHAVRTSIALNYCRLSSTKTLHATGIIQRKAARKCDPKILSENNPELLKNLP